MTRDEIYGLRGWVKKNLNITALELTHDVHDLLFKREFLFAVIGALAQHEGFDDASQDVGCQCSVRNQDRSVRLIVQARGS
jgi:hypothetical protein